MLKATPPTKKKRLGWVQDWVGDWFSEALPAVGKLPMCRRSQECSRISLHRTFLVPLRGCCCLPIPLVIGTLAAPQSNYYYNNNNIQIQLQLLQHTNPTSTTTTYNSKSFPWHTWSGPFFVLCCLQKEHPTSVAKPRSWKDPERTYQVPT